LLSEVGRPEYVGACVGSSHCNVSDVSVLLQIIGLQHA
jgi:hypothetical protein